MKASDLFVRALEAEGVQYVFGIPGEENLDLLESLRTSSIKLILTRHEQGAGFMAATYGRLTGKAGVCLATLGPGATNFVTAAAYAQLGAMPMLMLTGQKPVKVSKQGHFQIVDVVSMMRPLTKYTNQIVAADNIPARVREAFRLAEQERPGAVHLELPEDIARDHTDAPLIPKSHARRPIADEGAVARAVEALERDARGFPEGRVRSEAMLVVSQAYEHGLGEFAYQNKLDLRGRIRFPHGAEPAPAAAALGLPRRALVPIGGGKDSLVSIETLKRAGDPVAVVWIGRSELIRACAQATGQPLLNIEREIAPELFERQGDAQSYGEVSRLLAEVIDKVPDAQVMGDLDAAVRWAAANGGDVSKLGVTGFCWGGRQTWLYSAHNRHVKAGVAWYGRLMGEQSQRTPQNPIDVAPKLAGPVLGLYGGADDGIPLASVERMFGDHDQFITLGREVAGGGGKGGDVVDGPLEASAGRRRGGRGRGARRACT